MTNSKELKEKILNNLLDKWVWSKVGVWDEHQKKNVEYDSFYNPILKEGVDGRLLTEEDRKEVKEAIKKAKSEKMLENKKKILGNLSEWSIDPLGCLVEAKELKKRTYEDFNQYWFEHLPSVSVGKDNYQEICRAMLNNIKQHASEWKIESEGKLTIIKHDSGKKHYKEGLGEKEWKEIKQVLSQSQQSTGNSQQSQQETQPLEAKQQTPNFPFPSSSDSSSKY